MKIVGLKRVGKDDGLKKHWEVYDGKYFIWKTGVWFEPYEIFEGEDYLFCAFSLKGAKNKIDNHIEEQLKKERK